MPSWKMPRTRIEKMEAEFSGVSKTNIKVKLIGEDGNAFFILGKVREALIKNGRKDLVEEFMKEAQSGNYDHLLATVMEYVEVE